MANFSCEYCGISKPSITGLTGSACTNHPEGAGMGTHKLYEGTEKSQYSCKYCGINRPSISSLTASSCARHPDGANKAQHAPAL